MKSKLMRLQKVSTHVSLTLVEFSASGPICIRTSLQSVV